MLSMFSVVVSFLESGAIGNTPLMRQCPLQCGLVFANALVGKLVMIRTFLLCFSREWAHAVAVFAVAVRYAPAKLLF